MPAVVNCKKAELSKRGFRDFADWASRPEHLYIGREMNFYVAGAKASKWRNPYTLKRYTLDESLALYEQRVRSDPQLWGALDELTNLAELGCWCKPSRCHGDVLIRLLAEKVQARSSAECSNTQATRKRGRDT